MTFGEKEGGMESWRKVWRDGLAPILPASGLRALEKALEDDDPRLIQGATTAPPPLLCVQDWPVEGACALGMCAWRKRPKVRVATVEAAFAAWCFKCDQRMGEPAAARWLLNFWDETPRQEVRRALLPEVQLELARREGKSDE